MSDLSTIQLIDAYLEEADVPSFFSTFFKSPAQNFYTTEEVELDIQRDSEDVAVAITDLSVGPHHNESTTFTNKKFTAPIYSEEGAVNSYDMIRRQPGQSPFSSPDYAVNATRAAFGVYRKVEKKIRRAVELQCSQTLLTGKTTLINKAGVAVYSLDFSPKTTHFVNATGAVWAVNGSTGDPLGNLAALATVIRKDGKRSPDTLIFGDSAFSRFLANTAVKAALDNRRIEIGLIAPQNRGGATLQGNIWIGSYRFEMWTNVGDYNHPQTGVSTPFLDTNKVIMLSSTARLDLTWGAIPMIVPPDQRALPFLPPRISSEGGRLDLTTSAWITPNGQSVMISASSRPLAIPTAIDTFGAINVSTT
jgi:hypothetical protein